MRGSDLRTKSRDGINLNSIQNLLRCPFLGHFNRQLPAMSRRDHNLVSSLAANHLASWQGNDEFNGEADWGHDNGNSPCDGTASAGFMPEG